MPRKLITTDIKGFMILLGTGTSVGVPAIGCGCDVCTSEDPRNRRTRCSTILGLPEGNLLIDTSPDLRTQLVREKIGIVDTVIYTHEHTDHIVGFHDLRLFQFYLGHPVPIFCHETVESRLRKAFDYAFSDEETTHAGARPAVNLTRLDHSPVDILGATIIPIPMKHGPKFDVFGFRIGNIAYCTDTNEISDESMELIKGVDTLILDALRPEPHPTHFSIDEAVEIAKRIGAEKTYFTHCSCKVDYETINAELPAGIEVGFDGLKIPFSL